MQWPWNKAENDLDLEVQHHLEMLAEAHRRDGLTPDEAMRRARLEFGAPDRVREECRDIRWWNWLTQLRQDIGFGWRVMRKARAITVAAVASLALGIGATTTIASLADALLWRSLPVPSSEQLLEVFWESKTHPDELIRGSSGSGFLDGGLQVGDFFSKPTYEVMRSRAAQKAEVAAHMSSSEVSTNFLGSVVIARLRPVTGNFFSMLRLEAFAGRLLADVDDSGNSVPTVVVTHRFWMKHLSGSFKVIGQTMRINNALYTIIGVLPNSFFGIVPGDATDLYTPLQKSPTFLSLDSWFRQRAADPFAWWLQILVRRSPSASEQEVRNLLDTAFASTWGAPPKSPEVTPHVRLIGASRGLGSIRRSIGNPIWILLGFVGLVLVITCANIANLLLARAVARQKEVGMRISLGCSQGRLARQFFTESLLLAAIGGVLSIGVAVVLGDFMINLIPKGSDGMALSVRPDLRSLAATSFITLMTAILFGLYPAWRASRVNPVSALKENSGSAGTMSRARWAPAKMLVFIQVSLGVLLVTSAILFTNSLRQTVSRETGFERGHVLLFDIRPGEVGHQAGRLRQFYVALESRLQDVAGVRAVGLSRTRPMRGGGYWDRVQTPGRGQAVQSAIHHVTSSFLNALGVPLIAGRMMTVSELQAGANVAIVSEDLVKQLDLTSPLGSRVSTDGVDYQVIGVSKSARYSDMFRSPPVVYVPFDYAQQSTTVVMRTQARPLMVLGAVRSAIKELDPDLPLVDIYTMEQQISRTLQREYLFAWLCGCFGVLALVLCAVGLYGLMSHTTARRTPEIGIRIALGASRGDIMGQVLSEGMSLVTLGLVSGAPLAVYVARAPATQNLLSGGPLPYRTLVAAVGILAISAAAAIIGPALRASSIDPIRAIRQGE